MFVKRPRLFHVIRSENTTFFEHVDETARPVVPGKLVGGRGRPREVWTSKTASAPISAEVICVKHLLVSRAERKQRKRRSPREHRTTACLLETFFGERSDDWRHDVRFSFRMSRLQFMSVLYSTKRNAVGKQFYVEFVVFYCIYVSCPSSFRSVNLLWRTISHLNVSKRLWPLRRLTEKSWIRNLFAHDPHK